MTTPPTKSLALPERLMAMANCEANEVADIMNESAERIANLEQELERIRVLEPVAWTLRETLEKKETTTRGHLWFSDPVNSSWVPLFTLPPNLKG